MSTTYNTIWSMFLQNCQVDDLDLPQTDDGKYDMIKNGVLHFNNRLQDNLQTDNLTETVDRDLSDNHLLILAHFLRLALLINKTTLFSLTWQPFMKDIGLKNFSYQLKTLEFLVEKQEEKIDSIILSQQEDFM